MWCCEKLNPILSSTSQEQKYKVRWFVWWGKCFKRVIRTFPFKKKQQHILGSKRLNSNKTFLNWSSRLPQPATAKQATMAARQSTPLVFKHDSTDLVTLSVNSLGTFAPKNCITACITALTMPKPNLNQLTILTTKHVKLWHSFKNTGNTLLINR